MSQTPNNNTLSEQVQELKRLYDVFLSLKHKTLSASENFKNYVYFLHEICGRKQNKLAQQLNLSTARINNIIEDVQKKKGGAT